MRVCVRALARTRVHTHRRGIDLNTANEDIAEELRVIESTRLGDARGAPVGWQALEHAYLVEVDQDAAVVVRLGGAHQRKGLDRAILCCIAEGAKPLFAQGGNLRAKVRDGSALSLFRIDATACKLGLEHLEEVVARIVPVPLQLFKTLAVVAWHTHVLEGQRRRVLARLDVVDARGAVKLSEPPGLRLGRPLLHRLDEHALGPEPLGLFLRGSRVVFCPLALGHVLFVLLELLLGVVHRGHAVRRMLPAQFSAEKRK